MAGVSIGPPNVLGLPKPASSMRTSSTLGAPSGGVGVMLIVQSAAEVRSERPIAPPKAGSGIGQHRAVGDELERRLGKRVLEAAHALLVHGDDRLGRRAGERPLGGQAVLVVDHGDDGGRARLELLAEAALHAALDLVVHELADEAAGRGSYRDGGEQRRRRQADEHADAAAPAEALTAEVVAGLADVDLAVRVALDEDHALGADLLRLDQRYQGVEVLLRRLRRRIRGHDHVVGVTHGLPLRPAARR